MQRVPVPPIHKVPQAQLYFPRNLDNKTSSQGPSCPQLPFSQGWGKGRESAHPQHSPQSQPSGHRATLLPAPSLPFTLSISPEARSTSRTGGSRRVASRGMSPLLELGGEQGSPEEREPVLGRRGGDSAQPLSLVREEELRKAKSSRGAAGGLGGGEVLACRRDPPAAGASCGLAPVSGLRLQGDSEASAGPLMPSLFLLVALGLGCRRL